MNMSSRICLPSFIYLIFQCFQVTTGIHSLIFCEICCALIYIKCQLNLGRENQMVSNNPQKYVTIKLLLQLLVLLRSYEKGLLDFKWCWTQSVVDLWWTFWAKLLVHKQLLRVLINVNWYVNRHCDLWNHPPPPSAFRKFLPQQKRSTALSWLSSEWLNNSGESDFSRTSWGLCLWSNTTRGFDTLKTLLRIWLWWKVALAEGVCEWWPSCSVPST